ncbi:hypothetical protein SOVF_162210 [Spinacia oleracea]|nr:hypothetical protein SOVF_162210 [Spinacia oleracea]
MLKCQVFLSRGLFFLSVLLPVQFEAQVCWWLFLCGCCLSSCYCRLCLVASGSAGSGCGQSVVVVGCGLCSCRLQGG